VSGPRPADAPAPIALGAGTGAPAVRRATHRDRRAAFLDRDGVLNAGVPDPSSGLLESPLAVEDVRLLPGVPGALRELAGAGYALICVTNQPAAAKGRSSIAELLSVHRRVLELLAREGVQLEASWLCPHHPAGVVAELSVSCPCRKPAPGMLLSAAADGALDLRASWMIGDTDTDVAAGAAAGCGTVLVEYPGSAHKRAGRSGCDLVAADLAAAVSRVLPGSTRAAIA
jgi:D-glycero-D-manno-heptose 1,7-bisphosphate phosphatase